MKPEDVLHEDFLKQFKTGSELTSFIEQLHKCGVEKILEGELDAHLDYSKHQKSNNSNSQNGYGTKTIKTNLGATQIQVSRDRNGSHNFSGD
jgi:transposase-like protein